MAERFALKRLTLSDLTFFSSQFRQHPDVRQKAINLNATVFIDAVYPALTDTEQGRAGRIPLDLSIYGPGLTGELNVQRKIVKGAAYKNWRLNGELVDDPERPDRFDQLSPGDLVIFEFIGDLYPVAAKALFLARAVAEDSALHGALNGVLGTASMTVLGQQDLTDIIEAAVPANNHPIHEFMLDEALEDVVQGGSRGIERLLRRRSGNRLSREQLLQAKEKFDEVGRRGEECVNLYLRKLVDEGHIHGFEWVSDENAISPFDFRIQPEEDEPSTRVLLDVKSTSGPFDRTIHVSLSELRVMAGAPERYDLYRVFEMTDDTAQLRIASDMRAFAQQVLDVLDDLPFGALADGISLNPSELPFGEAINIELIEGPDDEFHLLPPA